MDIIHKYYGWILGIILILNILTCLMYRYTSEPSVVGMGLMLYLLPLLCIQILTTIVGYIFVSNQTGNDICLILNVLILFISIYCALSIK